MSDSEKHNRLKQHMDCVIREVDRILTTKFTKDLQRKL